LFALVGQIKGLIVNWLLINRTFSARAQNGINRFRKKASDSEGEEYSGFGKNRDTLDQLSQQALTSQRNLQPRRLIPSRKWRSEKRTNREINRLWRAPFTLLVKVVFFVMRLSGSA